MHLHPVFYLLSAATASALIPRAADAPKCADLNAKSNDGDRKIAIVIDSSGSMDSEDPYDLRLSAARTINNWLVMKSEATGGTKEDLVTVVDFDSSASLLYPLGDPAGASNSFDQIDSSGGTNIASGVEMAIDQLMKSGGSTKDRSGIIVFTDGEDSSVNALVSEINRATAAGIRVSFGFLATSFGSGLQFQNVEVQRSILKSGGYYASIGSANSSSAFINGALVNGLTNKDNPEGSNTFLLADLFTAHFISGSESQEYTYKARKDEQLTVTVQNIDASTLTAEAKYLGKTVKKTSVARGDYENIVVDARNGGSLQVKISANSASSNSIFIIGAASNLGFQNCTVGVGGGGSLTPQGKLGIGLAVGLILPILVGFIGLYFCLKPCFFPPKHSPGHGIPTTMMDPGPNAPYQRGVEKGPMTPQTTDIPSPQTPPAHPISPSFPTPFMPPIPPVLPQASAPPSKRNPYTNTHPHDGPQSPHDGPSNDFKKPHHPDAHEQPRSSDFDKPTPPSDPYSPSDPSDPASPDPHDPSSPDHEDHDRHRLRVRMRRNSQQEDKHHHHADKPECSIASGRACEDKRCPLNDKDHKCVEPHRECPCHCWDAGCPLNQAGARERRESQRRRRELAMLGLDAGKSAAGAAAVGAL